MEHDKKVGRNRIMERLIEIPKKMVPLHGTEHMAGFVLNDLCHNNCFNLKKAAYFVDNPDFNQFKGVVGYDSQEAFSSDPDRCWLDPEGFGKHMNNSGFNQRVRRFSSNSPKLEKTTEKDLIETIMLELSFDNPDYHSWHLKNDNHGLLIFEHGNGIDRCWTQEDLTHGAHLLSFCPIF